MPNTPFDWSPKESLLSYEELFGFLKVAIDRGVNKIRITGGEPLIRPDLHHFIKMISDYKKDIDLALTTNGYFLDKYAQKLKDAGLGRINISLDTLNPKHAQKIAQKNVLPKVLEGIKHAQKIGLKIKINTVPLKNINEDDILEILEFGIKNNFTVRFIEYMSNFHASKDIQGLYGKEILNIIKTKYQFHKIGIIGNSPSFYYELNSGYRFGVIDPHKDDFCKNCNRMRLSADGNIIPCLYFDDSLNISSAVKNNNEKEVNRILDKALAEKPEKNSWSYENENKVSSRAFYYTGG